MNRHFINSNNLIESTKGSTVWYWDPNGIASGLGGSGVFESNNWRMGSETAPLGSWPRTNTNSNKTMIISGSNSTINPIESDDYNIYLNKIRCLVDASIQGRGYTSGSPPFQTFSIQKMDLYFVNLNPEIYVESSKTLSLGLYSDVINSSYPDIIQASTLIKSGAGILVLEENFNSAIGNLPLTPRNISSIIVNAGILRLLFNVVSSNRLPTNSLIVNSGGIVELGGAASSNTYTIPISGSGIVRIISTKTPFLFNVSNSSFSGSYELTAGGGYVVFNNDASIGTSSVGLTASGVSAGFYFNTSGNTLAATRTITLVGGCNFFLNGVSGRTNTISALITGNGSITKQSGETIMITNANNNYTGFTAIRGSGTNTALESITRLSSGSVLGGSAGSATDSGNIVFNDSGVNGILEFSSVSSLGPCSQVRFRNTGGGAGNGGCLRYTGSTSETITKTIQCDTGVGIRLESNSTGVGNITYNGSFSQTNRPLYLGGTGSGILNNIFSGSGSITKRGTGSWTLGGNNTYSGGTTINTGTIVVNNTNALGTNTVTINSGATLNLNGFTIPNTIVNNGGTVIP